MFVKGRCVSYGLLRMMAKLVRDYQIAIVMGGRVCSYATPVFPMIDPFPAVRRFLAPGFVLRDQSCSSS